MTTLASPKDLPKAGVKRKQQQSSSNALKKRKVDDNNKNTKNNTDKPKQLQGYSSNWKLLQQTLPKTTSKPVKKRPINQLSKKQDETVKKENVR